MPQEQSSPETTAAMRERVLRTESHRTLRRAAEIYAELADDLEGAASRAGLDGMDHFGRHSLIASNVAELRERAGHARFIAATAFKPDAA